MKLSPKSLALLHYAIKSEGLEWPIANHIIHRPESPEVDELIEWLNILKEEPVHGAHSTSPQV